MCLHAITVVELKSLLGLSQSQDSGVVTITPDMASEILSRSNKQNRAIRANQVSFMVKILKSNNWHLTQDAISFNSKGILTNGQHRLTAVAKSGVAAKFLVCFNIEASTAIDTGAKRTLSDNIIIGNTCDSRIRDNRLIHSIFSSAFQYKNANQHQNLSSTTPDKLVELMNNYADDLIMCYNVGLFRKIHTKGCDNSVIKAALFIAYLNGVDLEVLSHIVDILISGIATSKYDAPIIGLRDTLMSVFGSGREISNYKMGLTQYCISRVCAKARTKTLKSEMIYSF